MTMNNCTTFNCKVLGYIDGIGGRVSGLSQNASNGIVCLTHV